VTRRHRATLLAFVGVVLALPAAAAADRDGDGLRDGFERRSGVSDPLRRDSDQDGIIDAAEDPDGDLLSNLGEQLFGSHPGRRDSDRDGIADGSEDADGDGFSNGRQQDRRPVPAGLEPTLARAPTAWPWARRTCQTVHGAWRIRPCKFGDRQGHSTIVLFGDSHATQWLPALSMVGKREGWRVVLITKTGCPSVDVLPQGQRDLDEGRSCAAWRDAGIRWIRARRPAVVIVSNLRAYPGDDLKAAWRPGLQRTLASFPRHTQAIVLADTPRLRNMPAPCLERNSTNIAACVTQRAQAFNRDHDRSEQDVARSVGAGFMNLSWKVCPYDPCPLVIGRTMLWRDNAHITARFSRQLAPSMRRQLLDALGGSIAAARDRPPAGPDGSQLTIPVPIPVPAEPPFPTRDDAVPSQDRSAAVEPVAR
jgi:hypothetical protein